MAESLYYSPKTIITFLIGYTPIQTKKLKKKKRQAVVGDVCVCVCVCVWKRVEKDGKGRKGE